MHTIGIHHLFFVSRPCPLTGCFCYLTPLFSLSTRCCYKCLSISLIISLSLPISLSSCFCIILSGLFQCHTLPKKVQCFVIFCPLKIQDAQIRTIHICHSASGLTIKLHPTSTRMGLELEVQAAHAVQRAWLMKTPSKCPTDQGGIQAKIT